MNLQKGFKMSYPSVCYSQMTLLLLMSPGSELMENWGDGDIHWSLEALELVNQRMNTFIAISVEGKMRREKSQLKRCRYQRSRSLNI